MTVRVKITHDQPEYPAEIAVRVVDVYGEPMSDAVQMIRQGQSATVFIGPEQLILLSEKTRDA